MTQFRSKGKGKGRKVFPLKLNSNRMKIQASITVPSTQYDKKISEAAFRNRVKQTKIFMDKTFGGDTSVNAIGGWYDDSKNKLIEEPVVKIGTRGR